jgi:hypothetical protein
VNHQTLFHSLNFQIQILEQHSFGHFLIGLKRQASSSAPKHKEINKQNKLEAKKVATNLRFVFYVFGTIGII